MKFEPKFYKNWKDDNHCLQASVMMVLNTLNGETNWDEVNKITQYQDGLYSWIPVAAVVLAERIAGVKLFGRMDYKQFAERGEEYYREHNSEDPNWFELQKSHASPGFQKEQQASQILIQKDLFEQKSVFNKAEIEKLLGDHFLIALVDSGLLRGQNSSAGHFVVLYGQDNNNFILHDPGLPPIRGLIVEKNQFIKSFRGDLITIPKGNNSFGKKVGRNDPCPCGSGKKYKHCCGR